MFREDGVDFAREHEDLTPRELALKYTDEKRYFVSVASVDCILSAEDLVTAPAHVVIRAAGEFRDKTSPPNEVWQADFTDLKVVGWGWFYLIAILDEYSRYIIAWRLFTTMKATDVTDMLELALDASGCNCATIMQKPRLLSDNGSSYVAADLAAYLDGKGMGEGYGLRARCTASSSDPGKDRALAPDHQEPRAVRKLLLAWLSRLAISNPRSALSSIPTTTIDTTRA